MIFKKSKIKGFTLIELLVVISIISLLSSIVFASLNSARAKARNAARFSSIHTLVNAFNLSLTGSGSFFWTGPSNYFCVSTTCGGVWVVYGSNGALDTWLAPSLPKKPSDPTDGNRGYNGYLYINPDTISGITGAYIHYTIETPGSCSPGIAWDTQTNYILCGLKID